MLYRCPRKVISDEARALMRAYHDLERGFLPAAGAMQDQVAGFSRWVGVIDAERNQIEEERAALRRARGRGPLRPESTGD
jgi:hypothetical protein